jgi:hypothetical protein
MILIAVLAVLGLVQSAGAQEIQDTQLFPIVARTEGLGVPPTQWVTDLTVHNVSDARVVVGVQFFPANQANQLDPSFPDRITLGPRETRLIEDVLAALFGFTTDTTGALLLTCSREFIPSNPDDCAILATTRTYNVGSPEGTFGQSIPANDIVVNASGEPSIVTGARNDDSFRSNLGVANLSMVPVAVRYAILGGDGAVLADGTRNVPQLSVRQWALSRLGIGIVDGPLTVEIRLDPADVTPDPCEAESPNLFVAYVSKVDGNPEGTGDAEFLYAAPEEVFECPGD